MKKILITSTDLMMIQFLVPHVKKTGRRLQLERLL